MKATFGKELRKLRIDYDRRIVDLAGELGMSSAMLSAIETGERKPGESFVEKVVTALNLAEPKADQLRSLAAQERKRVEIDLQGSDEKEVELAVAFARRFQSLGDVDRERILKLLR